MFVGIIIYLAIDLKDSLQVFLVDDSGLLLGINFRLEVISFCPTHKFVGQIAGSDQTKRPLDTSTSKDQLILLNSIGRIKIVNNLEQKARKV